MNRNDGPGPGGDPLTGFGSSDAPDGSGQRRRGPDVMLLALGLLGLVMAILALLQQLAGVGPAGEWVAPAAALTVGAVLLIAGAAGMFTRRR